MFDGTYGTFERVKRNPTIQVIPVLDGKIVAAVEKQPGMPRMLGLFSGRCEDGEAPLAAAKRELLEESGIKAHRWVLLKRFSWPLGKIEWDTYLYAALGCRVVAAQSLDNGEQISPRAIGFDALLRLGRAQVGTEIALYLTEARHDSAKKAALLKALGLSRKGRKSI